MRPLARAGPRPYKGCATPSVESKSSIFLTHSRNHMPLRDDLAALLNEAHSAPYLFVGSGLSRRYLGTPDWEGLLRASCGHTGRAYEYFRAQAPTSLPSVASRMADVFYEKWWSDEAWSADRAARGIDCIAKSSPLKFIVADMVRAATKSPYQNRMGLPSSRCGALAFVDDGWFVVAKLLDIADSPSSTWPNPPARPARVPPARSMQHGGFGSTGGSTRI